MQQNQQLTKDVNNGNYSSMGDVQQPQRPRGINIERLLYHRTNIPLSTYYVDSVWKGITTIQWLLLLNDLFRDERIYTDA